MRMVFFCVTGYACPKLGLRYVANAIKFDYSRDYRCLLFGPVFTAGCESEVCIQSLDVDV